MVPECKYRLPCGWCDKFDKNCDVLLEHMKKEGLDISESDIAKKANNHDCYDSATSISSKPKTCKNCELSKPVYKSTSLVCPITKEFHHPDFICNVGKIEVLG